MTTEANIPDNIRRYLHELMLRTFENAVVFCTSRTPDPVALREGVVRVEEIAAFLGFDLSSATAIEDNDLFDFVRYDTDADGNVTGAQTMAEALAEVRVKIDVILDKEAAKARKETKRTLKEKGTAAQP
jgi:hypothetical protein